MGFNVLNQLIKSRNALFRDCCILVPEYQYDLWQRYRKHADSEAHIILTEGVKPLLEEKTALFYSGGAESLLAKTLLDNKGVKYDIITIPAVYVKADKRLKDELWYCGLALELGYRNAVLGIEKVQHIDKFCYEWTPYFYENFNRTFGTNYGSLSFDKTKVEVYQQLQELGVSFDKINVCKHNNNCDNCWKCFEKLCIIAYLEKRKLTTAERQQYADFITAYNSDEPNAYPYKDTLDIVMPHI